MRNNLMIFLHFLLFLFAVEDSSEWYSGSHNHAANNGMAIKVKFLFWFLLSIAFSLMISKLH